jgi:hypothetical protein
MSRFKKSGFKTSGLQNVRFTKRQVYKTSGLQNVRFTKRQVSLSSVAVLGAGIRDPGSGMGKTLDPG